MQKRSGREAKENPKGIGKYNGKGAHKGRGSTNGRRTNKVETAQRARGMLSNEGKTK